MNKKLAGWVDGHPGKAATVSSWIGQSVGLISALISVPLIIRAYGKHDAGLWYFLLGWATFFQLCDFGFSQSISRQISFSNATGPRGEQPQGSLFLNIRGPRSVAQVYVSTRRLFRWLSFAIAVLAILAERTVLFSGKLEGTPDARVCWYFVAAMAVVTNETRIAGTMLSGCFQVAWMRLAGAVIAVIQNALFLGALYFRAPMWIGGAIFFAGSLANLLCAEILVARKCPPLHTPAPKRAVIGAIWRMSWKQGIASTAAWFIFSVNPMLVGYWLGEAAVVALAVPTRMAMLMFAMLSEVSAPQLNFMVKLVGENDISGLLRKFFLALIFTALPGLFAYTTFAAVGSPFIQWWTLGEVTLEPSVILWLALYCWLALIQIQAACFVTAHGSQPFAPAAVCGAILNLGLACLFIPRYGLAGATFSTFLAQLFTGNWVALRLALQQLKTYSTRTPGVVIGSLRKAIDEVRRLPLLRKVFA